MGNIRKILCIGLIFFTTGSLAQTEQAVNSQDPVELELPANDAQAGTKPTVENPPPAPRNTAAPTQGLKPSEEISADIAVPFPVDI